MYCCFMSVLKTRLDKNTGKLNVYDADQTEEQKAIGLLLRHALDRKVELVRGDGTYEEFKICAELCMSSLIGKEFWRQNYSRVELSKYITIADEAIALLILENNVEEWIKQVETKETEKPAKKRRVTRYTGKGRNLDGRKKGWSLEGKERYNKIFDVIEKERKGEKSISREKDLIKDWGGCATEKELRWRAIGAANGKEEEIKKEMERIREEEKFVPRNSLNCN